MSKVIWIVLAFVSGAFLPLQGAFNSKLGKSGNSPVHASMISFMVGAAALALYILFTKQTFSWAGIKSAPAYAWIGGLLGAFYVTVIILAFPKLGPGLTFGLVVAGQMVVSAILEHFNILVAQPQPLSYMRIVGILLVIIGVIVIQKF